MTGVQVRSMFEARVASLKAERVRSNVRRALLVGAGLLALTVLTLFVARGLEIRRLRAEHLQLEAEKAKIRRDIDSLQAQLQKNSDLKLIEYLARKELGLVKPGEEVYLLVEEEEERR